MLRLVHITDSHHKSGHPQLALAVGVINALEPQPDLVIHGGDIINGYGTPAEMDLEMAEAAEILSRLRAPLIPICCNHDTHGEAVRGTLFQKHFGGDWVRDFSGHGYYILAVSGSVDIPRDLPVTEQELGTAPFGVGDPWSLRLFEERFAAHAGLRKIVFSHKPIFPTRDGLTEEDPEGKPVRIPFHNYSLPEEERERVAGVFEAHGVLAHYAGHVHLNARVVRNGVNYVVTSATQSFPGEVRVIDCHPDRVENRMLGVPGGRDIWVRWRNVCDSTHRTVRDFYAGHPDEREFVMR